MGADSCLYLFKDMGGSAPHAPSNSAHDPMVCSCTILQMQKNHLDMIETLKIITPFLI
jgi:hypothetical protein